MMPLFRALRLCTPIALACYVVTLAPTESRAQCAYPCWSAIAKGATQYRAFSWVAETFDANYAYNHPYPIQTAGSADTFGQCSFQSLPHTWYEPIFQSPGTFSWIGPLTGSIQRHPGSLHLSVWASGWKGISFLGHFPGTISGTSNTETNAITQTVFFHTTLCYDAATEFGFFRRLIHPGNATQESTMYFYYVTQANCGDDDGNPFSGPPPGCRLKSTGAWVPQGPVGLVPVTIPGNNSQGGKDWYWKAWLTSSSTWKIEVQDPHSFTVATSTIHTIPVGHAFRSVASSMWSSGIAGYMTVANQKALQKTSATTWTGYVNAGTPAPAVKVKGVWAAK